MSVINQMLKDLDGRQDRAASTRFVESMQLRSAANMELGGTKQKVMWGVLLASAIAVCVFLLQGNKIDAQFSTLHQDKALALLSGSEFQKAIIAHSKIKANITHADWNFTQFGAVSLILQLDSSPDGSITKSTHESGEIEFVLPATHIVAALPMLQVEGSPLDSYRIGQRGDDVVITVKPKPNAEISYVVQDSESGGQAIEWTLTTKPAAVEPVTREVNKVAGIRNSVRVNRNGTATGIKKPPNKARRDRASYQRALGYFESGRTSMAIDELHQVLAQNSSRHEARELLANIFRQTGRSTEANMLLREGISIDPSYLAFTRLYADSLIESGELNQAEKILVAGLGYAHDDADYHALLAAVAQRLASHDQAVTHYMQALEIQPKRSAWWMGMAISLEALGKNQAATGAYTAAIDSGQLNVKLLSYVESRLQSLEQI